MLRNAPEWVATPAAAIRQMPPRSGRLAYSAMALLTALRQRTDFVFCGHLYMAPLGWLVAGLRGAKLIVQMHGIEAWLRPTRLQRAAAEAADLILCVSRHTRACVAGWAAIAPERVLVLPNTIADAFAPGDGSGLRAALGLSGKHMLLTVGRIDSRERYKGHDRVIAALFEIVARGHDVAYVIIGDGDDRSRLEELARKAGVAERVYFLGAVSQECLVEAYHMADLFVMPSTGEGFGIVFLEAIASGHAGARSRRRRCQRCAGGRGTRHRSFGGRSRARDHSPSRDASARPERSVTSRPRALRPGGIPLTTRPGL
jgi:phosphatidyl-myo-inositol dimannoside synthase